MAWWVVVLLTITGILLSAVLGVVAIGRLRNREPYRHFMNLRSRRKLTFVRLVIRDHRVPLYVKAIPFLLALYLMCPIDIIPDFIPVLGYLDDVFVALFAFFLIFKLTSRPVVLDLIEKAKAADTAT